MHPDRLFSAVPEQRKLARTFYEQVKDLPLICPHGHVQPSLLSDPDARFGNPAELFVIPDHYVFRMLYSQGVKLEDLGVPSQDGTNVEADPRKIWQRFAEHFYLFAATPTGLWIKDELASVFGIEEKLTAQSANAIYDELEHKLSLDDYSPRALFKRFNIEVLCTTDAATDSLHEHQSLHDEGWTQIKPTFRPDALINLNTQGWWSNLAQLQEQVGYSIESYEQFVSALEDRRSFFKNLGATATDHASLTAQTEALSKQEASAMFERALKNNISSNDAARFTAHMLQEMARMSSEDGLVMQLHVGSYRNHNQQVFDRFGLDKGADIPISTQWTTGLQPLLNNYANHPDFRLILFTLDESTYSRELAPLAGHYPALRLGPPWWFFDSVKGIERYFDAVVETAGIYNLAGFNDDTRAFASIPARHDVWRRVSCNWLAGECLKHIIDEEDAALLAKELAYNLAKKAYKL